MSIRERLSGNEAAATAMKQINPDVVAAFPITPSTEIPQYFSTFVNNGAVDTEFVAVESEHSAMSACIGAEAAGGRAMTATSANGLSFMWEMIYIALSGHTGKHKPHCLHFSLKKTGLILLQSPVLNSIAFPASYIFPPSVNSCQGVFWLILNSDINFSFLMIN